MRGSVHVRRQVAYAAQRAKVRLVCWRPRQQHSYVRVRQSRVERQVVTLTLRIERGEPRIVDHQVRAFGERAIPNVTADTAFDRRPRTGATDDSITGISQHRAELLGE